MIILRLSLRGGRRSSADEAIQSRLAQKKIGDGLPRRSFLAPRNDSM